MIENTQHQEIPSQTGFRVQKFVINGKQVIVTHDKALNCNEWTKLSEIMLMQCGENDDG